MDVLTSFIYRQSMVIPCKGDDKTCFSLVFFLKTTLHRFHCWVLFLGFSRLAFPYGDGYMRYDSKTEYRVSSGN